MSSVGDPRSGRDHAKTSDSIEGQQVNLIPYNPTGFYEGSTRKAIAAFKEVLDRARLPATVRLTRGRDIEAACGQLAAIGPDGARPS